MKKIMFFCLLLSISCLVKAQNDLDVFLSAGIEDSKTFAKDFLAPGTNGVMHSMNANWFNSAKVKPLGGFEISVVASASLVKDKHKTFNLNTDNYNNVSFVIGGNSQSVASVLGENMPDILVDLEYDDPVFGSSTVRVQLPQGIGEGSANLLPTAFIQGAVGISSGLELKARFVPKIETDDVSINMYGAALQYEFTKLLPANKLWPVAISGLVAYTHLDGSYDLSDTSGIDGENQKIENSTNTLLFQLIASTKLKIINFYGGIGYISGTSESDLLGTYTVTNGLVSGETLTNPFSVENKFNDVRATIGTKLKLGFFRLNAEYHLSEFNSFSLGINFGFR